MKYKYPRNTMCTYIFLILTVICCFIINKNAFAATEGDWEYEPITIYTSNHYYSGVVVTHYNGKQEKVVIPSKLGGKTVYQIGNDRGAVFEVSYDIDSNTYHGSITSVSIPSTVKVIGSRAFSSQNRVTEIILPNGIQKIGFGSFDGTAVKTLTIPKDCEELGDISNMPKVTTINIYSHLLSEKGNNLEISNCNALRSVLLPEGLKRIGIKACDNLKTIHFSQDLYSVDIRECPSIESIVLPDKVEDIYFEKCVNLLNITIPLSVTRIRDNAFRYCYALKNVSYKGTSYQWKAIIIGSNNEKLTNAKISTGATPQKGSLLVGKAIVDLKFIVTKRDKEVAFAGPVKTTLRDGFLFIPDTITIDYITYNVTSIANGACKGNNTITQVDIGGANGGNNLRTIGKSAFQNCKNIRRINIPKNVKSIGKSAFRNCKKLSYLRIKSKKLTEKSIGNRAFTGTYKRISIEVPKKKMKSYKKILRKKGMSKKAGYHY